MRISDWSSDVCSSDLLAPFPLARGNVEHRRHARLTCAVQHALLIFHQPLIVQMAMAIDQHQPALSGSSSRGKTGWGGDNVNPDFARRSYDPMLESAFVFRSASGTPSWSSSLAADAGITGEIGIADRKSTR